MVDVWGKWFQSLIGIMDYFNCGRLEPGTYLVFKVQLRE
ncbi:hypothetical protein B6N60_00068 [Richelia sinica FACHB-800]|uniref:Uncharacterized protein n=1 Tax=Richelia sinica FACHB-800 TaxID=1357546 RepID=A0A975T3G3_9NOST|nr:hypothetical protein B6N60_00068 [Richelia sinica FACHB-800]